MDDLDNWESWSWPIRPTTHASFEAMMAHLDERLAVRIPNPADRPVHAAERVIRVLGLPPAALFLPPDHRGSPSEGVDFVARVFDWYDKNYGDRLRREMVLGRVVLPLRGTYWKLRIAVAVGQVTLYTDRDVSTAKGDGSCPTYNVVRSLEGVTQGYAGRLTDHDLSRIVHAYMRGHSALESLQTLSGHELFDQARADYDFSVEALSSGTALSKARWDTAQCAEKVFKGLLAQGGHAYPRGGPNAHDIVYLGGLITKHLGIDLPENALRAIHCATSVRYGEMNVDENEAWTSHDALLDVLVRLHPSIRLSQ